jgi:hypothetical protein
VLALTLVQKGLPVLGGYTESGGAMTDEIEPLAPALWFRRIEMIARGELGPPERALRHAAHLLQLTPTPLRDIVRMSLEEESFEALLEARELDTAARHLIAQPTALTVKRESSGTVQAVISCVILKRAIQGSGETVASAVLDAWSTCLLALRDEYGADLLNLAETSPRGDRSKPRRRLTFH